MRPVRRRFRAAPTPIYYQLQLALQKEIQDGRWRPGDRIPPERHLAAQYGMSVGTVRQAIANLVHDGYLRRLQGSGTFVRDTVWNHETLRYYPMVAEFGDPIPDLAADLVSRRIVRAIPRVNRLLQIDPGERLLVIKRCIRLRRTPVVFSISHLPHDMFPRLETLRKEVLVTTPLYVLLEKDFGLPTVSNRELFSVARATAEVGRHLGMRAGDPLLQIEMLSLTYREQPYEHRVSFCRSDPERVLRVI